MSLVYYNKPPENGEWSIEYIVIEFWSMAQNAQDFKCIVATTHSEELAEKLVQEKPTLRTWVKAFRLYP